MRNIFLVMLPISVFLILFARPLIRVFFERGQFNAYSTAITSGALLCYAIGLMSFGATRIMVTAFHSLQDTKTPVKVAGACLLINVVLNLIFMFPFKVAGIALASAIAATVNFVALWILLDKRFKGFSAGLKGHMIKLVASAMLMGGVSYFCWQNLFGISEPLRLLGVGLISALVFLFSAVAFKIIDLSLLRSFFKRK